MEECSFVFENYEKLSIIICDADFSLIWIASTYAAVYLILNNFFLYILLQFDFSFTGIRKNMFRNGEFS